MARKNRKNCVATILLLLSSTSSAVSSPQADGNGVAAIKTGDGYVIVWNQPDLHFTLGLKGKDVRPVGSTGAGSIAFAADGVMFQVQSAAIGDFLKNARNQGLSEQAILMAHRDWESQYQQQAAGTKLTVTSVPQHLSNGIDALLWKFDMPRNSARQQVYLTTVSGAEVIVLNGTAAGDATVSESVVLNLLLASMATLRVSPIPIDLLKLRESLH